MKTQFKVIGFDLDGTLVNSLPDLALSVNSALADFGLPQAPEELVLTWIGNGAPVLIARALEWAKVQTGKDFSDAEMEQVKERFNVYYAENLCNVSRLYPNVKETLTRLKKQGIKELIMLTGDNESTAQSIAQQVGISQVYANLLPEDKAKIVQDYKLAGKKVAFIGDGINDSPSIALADVGIAMSSGTDIAIETSDIVLMSSNFDNLSYAHSLAKSTRKNMRQNILIALFVVIFLLSGLILGNSSGFIGQYVNMATGMFVHEASILLVILNAMRLIPHKKILSKNFTVAND